LWSCIGLRFSSHEAESYDDFNDRYQLFFEQAPDLFEVQVRLFSSLPSAYSCAVVLLGRWNGSYRRESEGKAS
jgi:hypothetical protein